MLNLPKAGSLEGCKLLTHAGCMDGSASAILFRHAGGLPEDIHYVPAGRVDAYLDDQVIPKDRGAPLLMVDISPNEERTVEWLTGRGNVAMIDHHKSAVRWAGRTPDFFVDVENTACGCENFRRWLTQRSPVIFGFAPPPYPFHGFRVNSTFEDPAYVRFCRIVDDHDRWQLKIPFSMELPKFFGFVGQKDFVERFMDIRTRFAEERASYWNQFEEDVMKLLRRIQDQRFRGLLQKFQKRNLVWEGRTYKGAYLISADVNNSELMNLYLQAHPEVDFCCKLNFDLQKIEYRGHGRMDLSRYCAQRGGGGHENAAGHPFPPGMIQGIIDAVNKG